MKFHWFRFSVSTLLLACFLSSFAVQTGYAEEASLAPPPASRLLPADTLAYLRIRDVDDLKEGFQRSSLGQMFDDPAMQPFVSDTYEVMKQTFTELASELGLTLPELLAIPRGQVAAALLQGVPDDTDTNSEAENDDELTDDQIRRRLQRRQRQLNSFAGVFMIDTGNDFQSADTMFELLDQVGKLAERDNSIKQTEKIGDHELIRWVRSRGRTSKLEWFHRDGMFVIGIGNQSAAEVLRRWNATDAPKNRKEAATQSAEDDVLTVGRLSGNADFAAVMTRCVGAEAETPQITFFVNPYAIAQRIIRRSSSSFFIMPIVEDLGISKIRGIGGSVFRGGELIESIIHLHVVIDAPRDGLFGVVRPQDVAPSPPSWIPAKLMSYSTAKWDIATSLDNLTKVVDRFAGEGGFNRFTEDRIQSRFDISLREDLIPNLTGRYVSMKRYQEPANWNSAARLDALQVTDPAKIETLIERVKAKLPPGELTTKKIAGTKVHFIKSRPRPNRELPETIRRPERSVFLLDDYLILANSREIVDAILEAHSGTADGLAMDSDFALLASEVGAKLGSEKPFYFEFSRDAENYRVLYEMAASPKSARLIQERAEQNEKLAGFAELLQSNQLPPFDDLRRYFNVSGIFGYNEPGGLHFGIMSLRPLE
ncbi:hypothetical protein SAMN06265222_10422 [Neorhodopirellula lusitana]|uniref:DUF3352 domain-containing protein n=1 Tax=Neorhodopirellula lusitana TaxID=445327 RepID=A0ABY1PZC9_9BACT|nr:DUF3352 domain-containing protein [Neorhodopirellula lusitana]SMP52922.1 hypothetical protein SAMN06265222_10422 [Neorhodopirellula lusitana]